MPVIDRPNTDAQRLQAMEAAKAKADVTAPADLAFSAATLALLVAFLPNFRTQMQERGSALGAQAGTTTLFDKAKAKLKMFIEHFFHVFNYGIVREVYTADQRAHFQLNVSQDTLPVLDTETQIQMWANRIVTGDPARVAAGGAAMSNPTAAQVATELTAYTTAQGNQTVKKDAYDAEQEDVEALREEADDIIADVWDECEFTFRKDTPASKRRKCREYGVVYRPRTGETPSPDDFSMMGTVTDSITGNPLSGALVVVQSPEVILISDSQGQYFVPVRPGGSYTVTAHKEGHEAETAIVVVVDGAITTHDFQLGPAETGTIAGNVTKTGVPATANIIVEGMASGASTDPMGNYSKDNVPAGPQVVKCALASDPTNFQTSPVVVTAGGTLTVNFNFP